MPTRVPARRPARVVPLVRVAVCVVLGLGVLGSCASGEEPDASASTGPSSAGSPTPSSAPTPTTTATPTPPVGGLRGRLLTAAEMPGANPGFRWRQGATRAEDPSTSFGTCQRFAITSIGAERVLVRSFTPVGAADGDRVERAGSLVATFADPLTARRAYAVLSAWRGRCADRLASYRRHDVGSLQAVSVEGGTAGWYLLTYGPVRGDPQADFYDSQAMAVVGSRIAMVTLQFAGQDRDDEPGREPAATAITTAARKLR